MVSENSNRMTRSKFEFFFNSERGIFVFTLLWAPCCSPLTVGTQKGLKELVVIVVVLALAAVVVLHHGILAFSGWCIPSTSCELALD